MMVMNFVAGELTEVFPARKQQKRTRTRNSSNELETRICDEGRRIKTNKVLNMITKLDVAATGEHLGVNSSYRGCLIMTACPKRHRSTFFLRRGRALRPRLCPRGREQRDLKLVSWCSFQRVRDSATKFFAACRECIRREEFGINFKHLSFFSFRDTLRQKQHKGGALDGRQDC